jgi:hypothetical protein
MSRHAGVMKEIEDATDSFVKRHKQGHVVANILCLGYSVSAYQRGWSPGVPEALACRFHRSVVYRWKVQSGRWFLLVVAAAAVAAVAATAAGAGGGTDADAAGADVVVVVVVVASSSPPPRRRRRHRRRHHRLTPLGSCCFSLTLSWWPRSCSRAQRQPSPWIAARCASCGSWRQSRPRRGQPQRLPLRARS